MLFITKHVILRAASGQRMEERGRPWIEEGSASCGECKGVAEVWRATSGEGAFGEWKATSD